MRANAPPRLWYIDSNTYRIGAPKGWIFSTMDYVFQDGVTRSLDATVTRDWTPTTVGELGLDVGPTDEASTFYKLYLVPSSGDDSVLTVIGSKALPTVGPSGYSNFRYFATVSNSSSSNLYQMNIIEDWFILGGVSEIGFNVHDHTSFNPTGQVGSWVALSGGSAMTVAVPLGVADAVILESSMDCDTGVNGWQVSHWALSSPSWVDGANLTQDSSQDANAYVRTVDLTDVAMYRRFMEGTNAVDNRIYCRGWHDAYRAI